MKRLKELYYFIENLGVRDDHSDEVVRSKKVLNKIIFAGLPLHFPFIFLFYYLGFYYLVIQVVVAFILISLSLYLCYISKNHIALVCDHLLHVTSVFFVGYMIKGNVGAEYVMLSVGLVPLFVAHRSIKSVMFLYSYLALSWFSLIFFNLEAVGLYELSSEQAKLIRIFSMFEFLIFTGCLIFYYISETNKMRQRLIDQHESLIQSAKLSDIGLMASGISHEIKNPLSIIYASVQVLERRDHSQDQLKHFSSISRSVDRILAMVRGLQHVARDGSNDDFKFESFDDVLKEVTSFTLHKMKASEVKLSIRIEENLPALYCRSVQIGQIMTNLFSNAVHAIQDKEEKWIKVKAYSDEGHIYVEVTDSGEGISPEVSENIFNAFYTTKPQGEGTGLGLSISANIMEAHKGKIGIKTDSPNTCFILIFPKVEEGKESDIA